MLEDIAHSSRRDMSKFLSSRNDYRLDLRGKPAVSISDGPLRLEIYHIPYTSYDMADAELATDVDREVIIMKDTHSFNPGSGLTYDIDLLFAGEEPLLSYVYSHCDDNLIKHRQGSLQDVQMACSKWVERSREQCYSFHIIWFYNCQLTGLFPVPASHALALEKCLHPKNAPRARGDGCAASRTQ